MHFISYEKYPPKLESSVRWHHYSQLDLNEARHFLIPVKSPDSVSSVQKTLET